jgi:tetratricopeptide (TPR) repeat protein
MEGLPTCANCLSIARDAKTMGLDVDGPQNDKGLYGLIPIHKVSSISNDYIIHWSAFSDKFAQRRFGFMSQVSPDGKFVVTSIDVPVGLEKIDAPATEFYRLFDISAQLADKKQFDAAVLAWNNALVLAPGDPRGHNNLDTLAEAGRVDEALPEFEESVELNPQRRRWGESGECAGRQGRAPGGSHSTIESRH